MTGPKPSTPLAALLFALAATRAGAQGPPPPILPPPPHPPSDEGAKKDSRPVDADALVKDGPSWPGLAPDSAEKLARSADAYSVYATRFTAVEDVRSAKYEDGEAEKETRRGYAYLLERGGLDVPFREVRQKLRSDGSAGGEISDEEPFPPAYAWVFLFSRFNQSYFAYREVGERFEGYDWVREFEFRGALPFTDGKDIRQWEGRVLVDAVTWTPIEIRAEPSRQRERIRLMFDRWQQSFNLIGIRMAPRPFGYRCRVVFRTRRDALTFPTELRYDTFRAISSKMNVPWSASVRAYDDYRFFKAETQETPGETKPRP